MGSAAELTRRWRSWWTAVIVSIHTLIVILLFAWTYSNSHNEHIHPLLWLIDFPAIGLCYYVDSGLIWMGGGGGWFRGSVLGQFLGVLLVGGLQWSLIVGVLFWLCAPRPTTVRRCRKCQYDLRNLPEPRCPECGTPFYPAEIADSHRTHS